MCLPVFSQMLGIGAVYLVGVSDSCCAATLEVVLISALASDWKPPANIFICPYLCSDSQTGKVGPDLCQLWDFPKISKVIRYSL